MFKTCFLALAIICSSLYSFPQQTPDFDQIKLETKEDFNAESDNAALKASEYLLSTVYDSKDLSRLKAAQYLMRWMTGSPTYTFTIDNIAMKISKKDSDLLWLYLAGMAKYCIENKESGKNEAEVRVNAIKIMLAYCQNPVYKVKIKGELKKLIEANEKGKLQDYLSK